VGAIPRVLPLSPENGWRISKDLLEGLVTARTKALVFNSPHNPTGRVFSHSEMDAVASCAHDHDLDVITDETYEYLVYDGNVHISLGSLHGMRKRTVSTYAFTKSYAMDGWRLGYAIAPANVVAAMTKIVQLDTAGPNTFAQYGAIEAVKSGASGAAPMAAEDHEARNLTIARLGEIGLPVTRIEGTIYAFPSIAGLGMTDEEFSHRFLDECRVAVTPGSSFGEQGRGHIRIAFGAVSRDSLSEALDRLASFVKSCR
jgi:aspartate aminotransferase